MGAQRKPLLIGVHYVGKPHGYFLIAYPWDGRLENWFTDMIANLLWAHQLIDCQYILFFDIPLVIPTDLLRVWLPSPESM